MLKFMPAEFKLTETRQPPLKDMYDEWLARVICYAFSVPASAFISQVNRATSETLRAQAATEGLVPLKGWVKSVLDRAIAAAFGWPDCEFFWVGDDAVDPLQQAQTISILVGAGVKTVAEARAELGLGRGAGVAKYNHYHDERGQFTDAEHAVEPGAGGARAPNRGVEVTEGYPTTMTDAGGTAKPTEVAQGGFGMPGEPAMLPEQAKPVEPPPAENIGSNTDLIDQKIVDQLQAENAKISPDKLVATGRMPDGTLVWLATGDNRSGLQHIIAEHGSEFAKVGIASADLPGILMKALEAGTVVDQQKGDGTRPVYKVDFNGQSYDIAITVGKNRYIVGANLQGRSK